MNINKAGKNSASLNFSSWAGINRLQSNLDRSLEKINLNPERSFQTSDAGSSDSDSKSVNLSNDKKYAGSSMRKILSRVLSKDQVVDTSQPVASLNYTTIRPSPTKI